MPPKRGGGRGNARTPISAPGAGRGSVVPARGLVSVASAGAPSPTTAAHVQSTGVKRPSYGTSGRAIKVIVNQFELNTDCPRIFHYDAVVPETKVMARALMAEIYQELKVQHPAVFGDLAFDGRKNLYSPRRLSFERDMQEFQVSLSEGGKVFHVRFTKTHQEIVPEVLKRFVTGQTTQDNDVTVAINALNVVLSMYPSESPRYTTNGKSFFIPDGAKMLGMGLVLWRGFFQSVRPTLGKMVVNIDISTGMMYRSGSLIELCLEHLGQPLGNPNALASPMNEGQRRSLSKFIAKVRIKTNHSADPNINARARTIRELVDTSAATTKFTIEGKTMSVKEFYEATYNKKLKFPNIVCVKLTSGAVLPMEICTVMEGQLRARAQPPPQLTRAVVEFATRKPAERLQSIKTALGALGYGQSPYLRAFNVNVNNEPSKVAARVLQTPVLTYAQGKKMNVPLGKGAWDMKGQRFYNASNVGQGWGILVFPPQQKWGMDKVMAVAAEVAKACTACGITGMAWPTVQPTVMYANPQAKITQTLQNLGVEHQKKSGKPPSLVVAILPSFGASATIYKSVKYFGDVRTGVATQCLMENKCTSRDGWPVTGTYYPNVALKINAKLGGTNVVAADTTRVFGDDKIPTLIMGADAIHPPPESQSKPSFTAVVGSLDINCSKYVATTRPQTSKQEIIDDMEEMTTSILKDHFDYRTAMEPRLGSPKPKRVVMYRDGVSEGQFAQVIELEIPQIKAALKKMDIDAKLTFIVVGKRHHVRMFPETGQDADRTGNCLAGTVVEQGVSHPVEFDFYLQSHAGLLGTSRPAHYNVLLDENEFTPDNLQQLTYSLCHIYARSTRSVSIPAPTYYADIVCARSSNHYDPEGPFRPDAFEHGSSDAQRLADAKQHFRPAHANTRRRMYFS